MKKKNRVKFILVIFIIGVLTYLTIYGLNFSIGSAKVNIPSVKNVRTGIDIRGGVRTILSAPEGIHPTSKQMDSIVAIIQRRLDSKSIYDRTVVAEKSSGRVVVEIPWKADEKDFDPQKAINELGQTALLSFQEIDVSKTLETGAYSPTGKIIMKGDDIVDATPTMGNNGNMEVALTLTASAQKAFQDATARLIGKPIGIFMDNNLISAPVVQSQITGNHFVITFNNNGTNVAAINAEVKNLADTIRAGALPFQLVTVEVVSISPLLGENALNISIIAGIVALILVWLFMILYYRLPGIIANIALLGHTVIQLLLISWSGITLTLPGIAGIILTVGMGVDANIIIFERIKEELRNGKTLKLAIEIGFKKAFTAILDANMTTLISSAVLYMFGTGPIQSFAIILGLGVILSFLTAVTASRIMLRSASEINIAKHHWLYGA